MFLLHHPGVAFLLVTLSLWLERGGIAGLIAMGGLLSLTLLRRGNPPCIYPPRVMRRLAMATSFSRRSGACWPDREHSCNVDVWTIGQPSVCDRHAARRKRTVI